MRSFIIPVLLAFGVTACTASAPVTNTASSTATMEKESDTASETSASATKSAAGTEKKEAQKRVIESVTFISETPPVSATERRSQTLVVNSDLSTELKTRDGYNNLLSEASGKITQTQFDQLSEQITAIDYIYLKPGRPAADATSKGAQTLVINSDLGAHRFTNNALQSIPEALQPVFDSKSQFMPKQAPKTETTADTASAPQAPETE